MKRNTTKLPKIFEYNEGISLEDWGGDYIEVVLTEDVKGAIKHNCDCLGIPSKKYIPKGNVAACFVWVSEPDITRYWIVFDVKSYTDRIAVHESVHATAAILYNKGVPLKASSEEAYAYLTDRIWSACTEIVHRGLQKVISNAKTN